MSNQKSTRRPGRKDEEVRKEKRLDQADELSEGALDEVIGGARIARPPDEEQESPP